MAENEEVQLLHESGQIQTTHNTGSNRSMIYAGAFLAFVVLVWGGLYFFKSSIESQVVDLKSEIAIIELARDNEAEIQVLSFYKQLKAANQLLSEHVVWSKAFSKLSELVEPSVVFDNLQTSLEDQRFTFTASTDSFTSVARQISAFYADESIKSINVGNISTDTDGRAGFSVIVEFIKKDFLLQ